MAMLDKSKLVDSDKLAAAHLATELNSGSSRVFNVDRAHRNALNQGATKDELLFKYNDLHRMIFIKQVIRDQTYQSERQGKIGTKLYFAFNETNALEGGKSIFVGDPKFDQALSFQIGFGRAKDHAGYIHDRDVIQILDNLPSLDPFLMKDRFEAEGIDPHPAYLQITPEEWTTIRDHVLDRFRPIVQLAFAGADNVNAEAKLRSLVQKMWEAKDMDSLRPIIQVMNLDEEDAPSALHAWKGVIYYDYRMKSVEPAMKNLAGWLAKSAEPIDAANKVQRQTIEEVKDAVKSKLRDHWMLVRRRLDEYNEAYKLLFIDNKSPGPFIQFLGNAPDVFSDLGDGLSRLDHACEVRASICQRHLSQRLKFEPLHQTLSMAFRILD